MSVERERERKSRKEGWREKEGEREKEREWEFIVLLLTMAALKGMTGALAPFSYLVPYSCPESIEFITEDLFVQHFNITIIN
jgi:hypothetical protein